MGFSRFDCLGWAWDSDFLGWAGHSHLLSWTRYSNLLGGIGNRDFLNRARDSYFLSGARYRNLLSRPRDGYFLCRSWNGDLLSRTWNSNFLGRAGYRDVLSRSWDAELNSSIRGHNLRGSLCWAGNRNRGAWDRLYDRDVVGDSNRFRNSRYNCLSRYRGCSRQCYRGFLIKGSRDDGYRSIC